MDCFHAAKMILCYTIDKYGLLNDKKPLYDTMIVKEYLKSMIFQVER